MFSEASFIFSKKLRESLNNKMGNDCINYGISTPCSILYNLKCYLINNVAWKKITIVNKKSRVQNQEYNQIMFLYSCGSRWENRLWSLSFNQLVNCGWLSCCIFAHLDWGKMKSLVTFGLAIFSMKIFICLLKSSLITDASSWHLCTLSQAFICINIKADKGIAQSHFQFMRVFLCVLAL